MDHPVFQNCLFLVGCTVLHYSVMRFRISSKNATELYIDHPGSENCLFLVRCILYYIILSWDSESFPKMLQNDIYRSCFSELSFFWLDLFHIKSYYHEIQNLFNNTSEWDIDGWIAFLGLFHTILGNISVIFQTTSWWHPWKWLSTSPDLASAKKMLTCRILMIWPLVLPQHGYGW